MKRYSLEPFLALTGWTLTKVREIAPCDGPELAKRRAQGVSKQIAERVAHAAGLHEYDVWPELLDEAISELERECECGERFVPIDARQRFCSRACSRRSYYERNRDAERARERARYWADPESARNRRRAYYAENGDYERARQQKYRRRMAS